MCPRIVVANLQTLIFFEHIVQSDLLPPDELHYVTIDSTPRLALGQRHSCEFLKAVWRREYLSSIRFEAHVHRERRDACDELVVKPELATSLERRSCWTIAYVREVFV